MRTAMRTAMMMFNQLIACVSPLPTIIIITIIMITIMIMMMIIM